MSFSDASATYGPHPTTANNSSINTHSSLQPQEGSSSARRTYAITEAFQFSSSSSTIEVFEPPIQPTRQEILTAGPSNTTTRLLTSIVRPLVDLVSRVKASAGAKPNSKFTNDADVDRRRDAIYFDIPGVTHHTQTHSPLPWLPDVISRELESAEQTMEGSLPATSCEASGASTTSMQPCSSGTTVSEPSITAEVVDVVATASSDNTTPDQSSEFAILAKNANIGAIWGTDEHWQIPELDRHGRITYDSIVKWAQRPYTKGSAIAVFEFGHPAAAVAISHCVASHFFTDPSGIVVATYFIDRNRPRGDVRKDIIPTLAYQICRDMAQIHSHLPFDDQGVYEREAAAQLYQLISRPLRKSGTMKNVLIIINGLDEVDLDWAAYLFELFVVQVRLRELPLVKILVTTSVNHNSFEELLRDTEAGKIWKGLL